MKINLTSSIASAIVVTIRTVEEHTGMKLNLGDLDIEATEIEQVSAQEGLATVQWGERRVDLSGTLLNGTKGYTFAAIIDVFGGGRGWNVSQVEIMVGEHLYKRVYYYKRETGTPHPCQGWEGNLRPAFGLSLRH